MTQDIVQKSNHRIDVHHHIVPPEYLAALDKIGVKDSVDFQFPKWSPEISLRTMDRYGIKAAIMSLSTPGVYFGDSDFACDLARQCNEIAAQTVSEHPDRFGFFAALPMPITQAATDEAVYALDTLNADGVGLLASVNDIFLGNPEFDPLMEELNKRRAVVFVHPNVHSSSKKILANVPNFVFEFVADTTRAVLNLMTQGVFERYPFIKWILAHAGGTIPYIAWRVSFCGYLPEFMEKIPRGGLSYLRNLYYDTALSSSRYAMSSLEEVSDPSHILFGSDFPFADSDLVRWQVELLSQPKLFKKASLEMVEESNALALFPKFKQYQQI